MGNLPLRAVASPKQRRSTDKLAQAHARFATAALWIYFASALAALSLLLVSEITGKAHNDEAAEEHLMLETEIHGKRLGDRLSLAVNELSRLGSRVEVNLEDESLDPERELLEVTHQASSLFDQGVAILDAKGDPLWAEPSSFIAPPRTLGLRPWFLDVRTEQKPRIVQPSPGKPVLYVVSPVVRDGRFTGALVGGLDLAADRSIIAESAERPYQTTLIATEAGRLVYAEHPFPFAERREWLGLFDRAPDAKISEVSLGNVPSVVTLARIPVGDLFYVTVAKQADLFRENDQRAWTRVFTGVMLALVTMLALVAFLRRSLEQFQRSETEAVREEHLRSIGEAANVIAHEVRNSLNGIRMGMDLVLDREHKTDERVLSELRAEIQRLSSFAYQLMLFAKNPEPQRARLDLSEAVPQWLSLTREVAQDSGVEVELVRAPGPVVVQGDAMLLQIVIGNLVSNALDAVAASSPPRVTVRMTTRNGLAEIWVEDNGAGVPAELGARLFEPFVSAKPSGVGMGLSISRKIARAHGGDLELAPSEAGATFVLTLPLEEP